MSDDPTRGGILTLDLAGRTGWAYGPIPREGRLTKPMAFGAWDNAKARGRRYGAAFASLADGVGDLFKMHRPSLVVMEAPLPVQAQKHDNTARVLLGFVSVVDMMCYRWEIECREQHANQARSGMKIKPHAKKEEIVDWCRARGLDVTDHNAADAIVLWYYAAALRS